jgi:phosphomannomutase
MLPENRSITIDAIKLHHSDLGIAWDGDFDRCFLFDEHGNFIEGYYIVGLLAESILSHNLGASIVHDPRLTWNTLDIVSEAGGEAIQSKSGHSFMKEKMREVDGIYGGEMSAHHYFRRFSYADSGMIPWLLVVELLSITGKPLSALVGECMAKYPVSGEINRKIDNPNSTLEALHQRYAGDALSIDDIDGYSFEFAEWRFNIRMSNTEPVVRLNVESRGNAALMEAKTAEILGQLQENQ